MKLKLTLVFILTVLISTVYSQKRGNLVGILGLSGSGKSTLLNILAGNLLPESFTMKFLDDAGKTLFEYSEKNLDQIDRYRFQIGLVAQDSHVFSETLSLNISMGQGTEEELASFWPWIKKLIPYLEKWNIQLDDKINPAILSAGQIQLISAIRACFLKKPVVLFDEISVQYR